MGVTDISNDRSITFFESTGKCQHYQGYVLGVERDYVWVIVPDLKEVFQSHPKHILVLNGKNCFEVYDRRKSINFAVKGVAPGDIRFFEYAKNEKALIKLVKGYQLIMP